jgi:hypothetical protein
MASSRRDRQVTLVGLSHLARHREPAVNVADFEDLILENDLLAVPRP